MAAADDPMKEESAVALDVMKASPEDVTVEENARPKRESLGAAIDAAIDGADKSTSDQKPS
jgi:hypothetical protein